MCLKLTRFVNTYMSINQRIPIRVESGIWAVEVGRTARPDALDHAAGSRSRVLTSAQSTSSPTASSSDGVNDSSGVLSTLMM